jgi:predicted amidohydrolase
VIAVAAVQHDIAWEDRDTTLQALAPLVAGAAGGGARLVLLTEMFAVGFSMATERTAEPPDGPTTAWLVAQAADHDAWVGGSVPVRPPGADRPRNTFVLAGPGGEVHRYEKRHPFAYAGELDHFEAGDDLVTVEIDGVRVSPAVCYDLRFADQFWGQATGTDCYVVVANWPRPRRHHWRTLLLARAIENQAYVVGVNRIGADGNGLDHAGDSLIIDPMGEVLADAGGQPATITATVDPAVVADVRARLPFLPDRR